MRVYLGAHHPHWLAKAELSSVPLFVSHRALRGRRSLPVAATDWALDSGGFTAVTQHGGYDETPRQYAAAVRRYREEVGRLAWASIQDYMCEPVALSATGRPLAEHQRLTVQSALDLTEIAPDLPWRYVLQGFAPDDYLRCLSLYRAAGIDATAFGLGSVCRRQGTGEAERLVERLGREGVTLHLFGFKMDGAGRVANLPCVESSDSMAWSYDGRRTRPCPVTGNVSCANCLHHALDWYGRLASRVERGRTRPRQLTLDAYWDDCREAA